MSAVNQDIRMHDRRKLIVFWMMAEITEEKMLIISQSFPLVSLIESEINYQRDMNVVKIIKA